MKDDPTVQTFRWLAALALLPAFALGTLSAQGSDPYPMVNSDAKSPQLKHHVSQPVSIMAAPEHLGEAKLGPDFLLDMTVLDAEELDSQLRVDTFGNVNLPLAGTVHVAGDSLVQAQMNIEAAFLKKEILKHPHVALTILQYAAGYVTVIGAVEDPGRLQLMSSRPLPEVLASAGGANSSAGFIVEIRRGDHSENVIVPFYAGHDDAKLWGTLVNPGDSVIVQAAKTVYVLGAVGRPGGYIMANAGKLNLLQALAFAQGTTPRATVSYAQIFRSDGEGHYKTLKLPLSKIQQGKYPIPNLQADDIVFIPSSGLKTMLLDAAPAIAAAANSLVYAAFR